MSRAQSEYCYPPPAAAGTASAPPLALLEHGLAAAVQAVRTTYSPSSKAEEAHEAFLYEGVGGAAYCLLHVDQRCSSSGEGSGDSNEWSAELPTVALDYATRASALYHAYTQQVHRKSVPLTFYCGSAGVQATLALACIRAGRVATAEQCIQSILADATRASSDESMPDELLYGRAGYLHALLLMHHAVSNTQQPAALRQHVAPLQHTIDHVFDQLITHGVQFPHKPIGAPLMWAWHGKLYLGAAHGVTGILYLLLSVSWRWGSTADARLRELVQGTLDWCVGIRLGSGNFPSSVSTDPDHEPSDRLVQWCHGAPALALVCIKAYEVWGEQRYLHVARELAEVVWSRGLLRKGVGLCHGIAGNAYVFLKLYAVTHEQSTLQQAVSFARFALEGAQREEMLARPDAPESLANGQAGLACFLADLLAQLRGQALPISFPAMDIM